MRALYHLIVSHYSEKARWALDFKGLTHVRRTLVPGFHRLVVWRVAGTTTVPVLVDDAAPRPIADSTDILAHLEAVCPDPPLFPDGPDERRRAVEIEDFFDERCGRHVSRLAYHILLDHPALLRRRWQTGLTPAGKALLWIGMPVLRTAVRRTMEVSADDAVRHRAAIAHACERLEGWLGESGDGYLVGGRFTVADLTAACMLGPLAAPQGSPWAANDRDPGPRALEDLRAEYRDRDAIAWVRRTWRRHR